MNDAANRVVIKGKGDRFAIFSTAVVLAVLQDRFANEEYFWRPVIKKSEEWFNAELASTLPAIDGKGIMEWAKEFVRGVFFVEHNEPG